MKNNVKWDLVDKAIATKLKKALMGFPTRDRVLICSVGNESTTVGGIILTKTPSSDSIPKKGVVIQLGEISEEYHGTQFENLVPGDVVYYGLYAGKQLDLSFDLETYPELAEVVDNYDFTVLSLSELLFIEPNK